MVTSVSEHKHLDPYKRGKQQIECRTLISGITGSDGPYLAELVLEKGYGVHFVQ